MSVIQSKVITAEVCLILFNSSTVSTLNFPASKHFSPRGRWDDGMWEKTPSVSFFLTVQSVEEEEDEEKKKVTIPLKRLSAIPAEPTHTMAACSQWWYSNLTDWAQGFVCLKPLTYFYSHCRSQSF